MPNKTRPYKPIDEIMLDIRVQMQELHKAEAAVGSFQLGPGEVYLSEKCYETIVDEYQFYYGRESEPKEIFGLPIYSVPIAGYHVRVASRLVMRPGVEL